MPVEDLSMYAGAMVDYMVEQMEQISKNKQFVHREEVENWIVCRRFGHCGDQMCFYRDPSAWISIGERYEQQHEYHAWYGLYGVLACGFVCTRGIGHDIC